jgi:hypothetical protein
LERLYLDGNPITRAKIYSLNSALPNCIIYFDPIASPTPRPNNALFPTTETTSTPVPAATSSPIPSATPDLPSEYVEIKGERYDAHIEVLKLYGKRLEDTDLSEFHYFTSAYSIDLENNLIADLSVSQISELNNLSSLILSKNKIIDIKPLSKLNSLDFLFLNKNQIIDISPLSNLNNLDSLFLNENQISDISPLINLQNLTILSMDGNPITQAN